MSAIDVTGAPDRLLANKTVTPGSCLMYVSRAIRNGLQPLIWNGLDTALNCWVLACGDKHTSRNVPRGFPAFLGSKRGNNAGDVIISLGNGKFAATDYPGWGVVGVCTLEQREVQTGRKYLGYAGEFLGYTLTSTTAASLDITPTVQEDIMAHAVVVQDQKDPHFNWIAVVAESGRLHEVAPDNRGWWDDLAACYTPTLEAKPVTEREYVTFVTANQPPHDGDTSVTVPSAKDIVTEFANRLAK